VRVIFDLTRAPPAYPSPRATGARALPQGESGEFAAPLELAMQGPFRGADRASGVCSIGPPRGMARRKAQSVWFRVRCGHGWRLSARQSQRLFGIGPRFPVRVLLKQKRNAQVVSQLLAGTPIGPGGSSDTARVPCCDKARGRHTSSRLRNASR
jgi:hypothetical protein